MSPPFGIRLYKTVPLPYRKGGDYSSLALREGGERAPVALCREPVYVATSVGAERSPLATSARAGRRDGGGHRKSRPSGRRDQGVGRLAPQANKIPLHFVRRDFFGWTFQLWLWFGQPPLKSRSAPQRRDFPAPRGHALRPRTWQTFFGQGIVKWGASWYHNCDSDKMRKNGVFSEW